MHTWVYVAADNQHGHRCSDLWRPGPSESLVVDAQVTESRPGS